jgi:hypothetical protein
MCQNDRCSVAVKVRMDNSTDKWKKQHGQLDIDSLTK